MTFSTDATVNKPVLTKLPLMHAQLRVFFPFVHLFTDIHLFPRFLPLQELDHIKVSIEQARLRHREAVAAATPEIQAPVRLAPPAESHETLEMPSVESTRRCSIDDGSNCFDHSRCSVSSGFPGRRDIGRLRWLFFSILTVL